MTPTAYRIITNGRVVFTGPTAANVRRLAPFFGGTAQRLVFSEWVNI